MHNDTTNVVKGPPGGEDFMITGPITVSVGGGPLATFTDPVRTFLSPRISVLASMVRRDSLY
jgi:hypothetical protein